METINTVITAVSIIICLVLIAYFIRWSAWKRVKPAYVRRNVMNFSWIQAVFLIAALLVNGIVMDIRGESGDYYALIPIIASVLLGIMCREALLKIIRKRWLKARAAILWWQTYLKRNCRVMQFWRGTTGCRPKRRLLPERL